MSKKKVDFLVIGSGVAGLTYALKVAEKGSVCIVTKSHEDESNTKYAQGGIAAVMYSPDSYNKHIEDTLICGAGLCDEKVVKMVVEESTERINELIDWGTQFDQKEDGSYKLAKEGGHSEHRILHHKDITGYEIERALIQKVKSHPQIEILDHHFAIDLLTQHHLGVRLTRSAKGIRCFGAYVLDEKTEEVITLLARKTVLASGGAGHVYRTTTNPLIATGDGIAMAYRAKANVKDMEFIQFHPTSLYNPGEYPSFLISEAVRGFGGILRTSDGQEFMYDYDERGSLAPRDIVARAIDNEMKSRGDEFAFLDCTHLDKEEFIEHFPNIYDKCMSIGIDVTRDFIPVIPAMHYTCGGLDVDKNGQTSLQDLYAVGECSSTGLHGANRLASNSLLEAVVYAHRAALDAVSQLDNTVFREEIPDWNDEGTEAPEEMVLITQSLKEVQEIMSNYVGIVRSNLRIQRALDRLEIIYRETEELYEKTTISVKLCELRNIINVAYLILKFARERSESVGLHYNLDNPFERPLKVKAVKQV